MHCGVGWPTSCNPSVTRSGPGHGLPCTMDSVLLTQHFVSTLGRVLPLHFQGVDDALVSLHGDAGHGEDSRHYGGGLDKRDSFAHQGTCRTDGKNTNLCHTPQHWDWKGRKCQVTAAVRNQMKTSMYGAAEVSTEVSMLTS